METTDSRPADPCGGVTVRAVAWQDPAAVLLRAALASETLLLSANLAPDPAALLLSLSVDVTAVVYAGVACAPDGLPVGHVAVVRRRGYEVAALYATPFGEPSATTAALLAAAEAVAAGRGATRLAVSVRDGEPLAVYTAAGYLPLSDAAPAIRAPFTRTLAKAVSPAPPGAGPRRLDGDFASPTV